MVIGMAQIVLSIRIVKVHMTNNSNVATEGLKVILVVEDDEAIGEVIKLVLAEEPQFYTILATTPQEALRLAENTQVDMLIIDYLLREMTGIELYDRLRVMKDLSTTPTIITSASLGQHTGELEQRQLIGMEKPFDLDTLMNTIKQLLAH